MEPIDPRVITGADWPGFQALVILLWLFVIFNVGFAGAMLLGHAVVPSLITTGHIPQRLGNFRPLLTILGFLSLLVALYVLFSWVSGMAVVYDVYPKRLI